jgi:cysteinyl-tRNA synthetase
MSLTLHNSLTSQKEEFRPADPKRVTIYNCGPTVYNLNHIGNFRSYIFVDLLRRYLKFRGYGVDHTSNITDIDDKIIDNSLREKKSIQEFTQPYIDAFLEDLKTLRIEGVEHRPRATESIPEMVEMMRDLEKNGHTYTMDGNLYFRISSFADYGRLSGIEPEALKSAAGGRFEADEYNKDDVRDFALWKAPSRPGEPTWDSPYGKGRPGWHLECSAMIHRIYGTGGIDIHAGGIDLLFPHHENEIAQSRCAHPGEAFVRYWMHNEHLLVDSKKMSKSAGNYFTLRDLTVAENAKRLVAEKRAPASLLELVEHGHIARALRYLLISTHYRTKLNFTFDTLNGADAACSRLQTLIHRLIEIAKIDEAGIAGLARQEESIAESGHGGDNFVTRANISSEAMRGFIEAMDDDLNISRAMASVFDHVRDLNTSIEKGALSPGDARDALLFFYEINRLLDVIEFAPAKERALEEVVSGDEAEMIRRMIEIRNQARKSKNFAESDRIRDELLSKGIRLKDTPSGTDWERV